MELVKAGAADYVAKPWDNSRLLTTVRNLLDLHAARAENRAIRRRRALARSELASRFDLKGLVYESEAMHALASTAARVAHADVPVLITGPNGAGKEVIADVVQANSTVKGGPYVKVNVGALPDTLMESELFGTEAGAFTGAKARTGRFEAADGGTIFLDELGNLSAQGQAKLLRVLQTGEYERLGSNTTRRTRARVIAATNSSLPQLIKDGRFREDLLYRLNVIELEVPSLAARQEDILPLAQHFLEPGFTLSQDALRALGRYHWPGNVRELGMRSTAPACCRWRAWSRPRRLRCRSRPSRPTARTSTARRSNGRCWWPTGSWRMPRATSACRARRSIAAWRSSASRLRSTRAARPRTSSRAAGTGVTLPSGSTGGILMKFLRLVPVLLAALAALPSQAGPDDRARVTALADRFVEEYQKNFPISYGFSGLPVKRNDGVDINSPEDVARWRELMKAMSAELATIKPDAFATEPEWVTWQFLDHAFKQDQATTLCRNELWSVSALGWQSSLSQIASVQPVGTDEARAQALARWRNFGPWIDREIANLKEGQRLGYSATEAAARSTLSQLDQMLAQTAGRIAADGSGRPRQDARLRRRVEAGHRGNRLARDHALSRLHAGRVSCHARASRPRSRACPTGARAIAPSFLRRRPWMPTRWSCSTSRRSRWSASAKSRSASGASCSATG